jgi:hypothetical protein
MYTAQVNRKEETTQGLRVYVDFLRNGIQSHTESVIPQDRAGFDFWLKDRLKTLNEGETLKTDLVDGEAVIPPADPVIEEPVLTAEEIARNTWLAKYTKWVRIKTTVVDTQIVPITNPKIDAMLQDLRSTILPEYIDHI